MSRENQITPVDNIANNVQELVKKAEELVRILPVLAASCLIDNAIQTGVKVVLDPEETVGTSLEMVDSSVCAILVRKKSARGAVRVDAPGMPNVVTGPDQIGFDIVVIRPGQTCRIFLTPTVRYFRRA